MRFMGRTYAAATAIMLAYSAFFSAAASAAKTDDKKLQKLQRRTFQDIQLLRSVLIWA